MKPHNNIDDYFKDNLSDNEIPMSGVEELWTKIDPDKPRRKLPFFLWFSLGIAGLIVAGLFIINADIVETILREPQHVDTSNANNTTEKIATTATPSQGVLKDKQNAIAARIPIDSEPVLKKTNKQITKNNASKIGPSSDTSLFSSSINLDSGSENKSDTRLSTSLYSLPSTKGEADLSIPEWKNEQLELLGLLSINYDYNLSYDRPLPSAQGLTTYMDKEIIKPLRFHKLWYGQASITSSLVSNMISSEGIDPTPTSEVWKRSVDPIASFQFFLSLGRRINSKSSINIGLEYQHIENQHTQDTVIISEKTMYSTEAYYTSNGFVGDSILVTTTTRGKRMKPLRETLINIPFRYSYNIIRKNNFGLDASFGLIMNLSRKQSGPVLNSNNEWVSVSDESQNRIGLGYEVGLSAMYNLCNDQAIFLAPRFRHSPSDHLENLPINLSRLYFGMELGYRMAF